MRRFLTVIAATTVLLMVSAPLALACGFLVSANGAVQLGRTTTFVSWEDGIERYITNFEFSGDAGSFGSIIPLPGEPISVTRAGDWTLQRLVREVAPRPRVGLLSIFAASSDDASGAQVILRTRIDSLDVVVLKGGGSDVLAWVNDNGFALPPGPETEHMLEFYSSRSPYFLAARFDSEAAEQDEFTSGDGIPILITVPTVRPWIPLHIFHGAVPDSEILEADLFLFTPERPDLLYGEGLEVNKSEWANDELLADLRSDENMEWVPDRAWFTHLVLETEAENVVYDLSVGVGDVAPSFVDAGFTRFEATEEHLDVMGLVRADPNREWKLAAGAVLIALIAGVAGGIVAGRRRAR